MKTSFKLTLSAVLTAAILGSSAAYAGASTNVGATTNYLFRGLTQTDDKPAVSGGLDYEMGNGFSIGTWASNIEFSDKKSYEVDVYGGYGNKIGALDYSVGFITYIYPDDDNADFTEITGGLGYGPVSFNVAYTVDADSPSLEDNIYYSLSASKDITPAGFSIGGLIGHNEPDTGSDYQHYQVSLSKGDFTAAIDMNEQDGEQNENDPVASLSWVHAFDL